MLTGTNLKNSSRKEIVIGEPLLRLAGLVGLAFRKLFVTGKKGCSRFVALSSWARFVIRLVRVTEKG